MTDREPTPYYESNYREKLMFFGDTAGLLLDTYGTPTIGNNEEPIDIATWSDEGIATSYELARYQPHAGVDARLLHQIDLKVTEAFPNGEYSVRTHSINTSTMTKATHIQQMTTAERADYEERVRLSKALKPDLSKDQLRILPPRKDDLQPEHHIELLLNVLNRGLEILEI